MQRQHSDRTGWCDQGVSNKEGEKRNRTSGGKGKGEGVRREKIGRRRESVDDGGGGSSAAASFVDAIHAFMSFPDFN